MGKIKLNISGNLVKIILPSAQTFLETKEQLKITVIKNYKLLKMVRFYKLDSSHFSEKELFELGEEIESLISLKSLKLLPKKESVEEEKIKFKLHYGDLRSGEKIISDTTLVVIGNLNPGSVVISKRNIFVYGKAHGRLEVISEYNKNYNKWIFIKETSTPKIKIDLENFVYEEKEVMNILFKKRKGKIEARQIDQIEIKRILAEIGFNLI